eukprot:1767354-Amphidinium_carterae.1
MGRFVFWPMWIRTCWKTFCPLGCLSVELLRRENLPSWDFGSHCQGVVWDGAFCRGAEDEQGRCCSVLGSLGGDGIIESQGTAP